MFITKKEYFKELEKMGFYLEGNTYKYDIGDHKCLSICNINGEIIYPEISKVKKFFYLFSKNNPQKRLEKIMLDLWNRNIINNVSFQKGDE